MSYRFLVFIPFPHFVGPELPHLGYHVATQSGNGDRSGVCLNQLHVRMEHLPFKRAVDHSRRPLCV